MTNSEYYIVVQTGKMLVFTSKPHIWTDNFHDALKFKDKSQANDLAESLNHPDFEVKVFLIKTTIEVIRID